MARIDNLTNFLTDVATSIRTKKGTTNKIAPKDFDTEIESIQSGGGTPNLQEKSVTITENTTTEIIADSDYDGLSKVSVTTNVAGGATGTLKYITENVNFLDYDGSVLYTYSLDTLKSMGGLPPIPDAGEFTPKMWNWTYDEIIEKNEPVDVGLLYQYDDNLAFQLTVNITDFLVGRESYINLIGSGYTTGQKPAYSIDWGDESEITTGRGTGTQYYPHTYTAPGIYKITIKENSGLDNIFVSGWSTGGSYARSNFFSNLPGSNFNSGTWLETTPWWNSIQNIIVGKKAKPLLCMCFKYSNLETIRFDYRVTYLIGYSMFRNCYNLKAIIVPRETTYTVSTSTGPQMHCYDCFSLNVFSFPKEVVTMTSPCSSMFRDSSSLKKIILPEGLTNFGSYNFYYCYSLEYLSLPKTITTMTTTPYMCSNDFALKTVIFNDGMTQLNGSNLFSQCFAVSKLHIPNTITNIPDAFTASMSSLTNIDIPNTITSIGSRAFGTYSGCTHFDFSKFTQIPTIASDTFNNSPSLKIIVPDNLYDTWIVSNNWSSFADHIVKASSQS